MAMIDAHEYFEREAAKKSKDRFGIIIRLTHSAKLTIFGINLHWHPADDDTLCFERTTLAIVIMNIGLVVGVFRYYPELGDAE